MAILDKVFKEKSEAPKKEEAKSTPKKGVKPAPSLGVSRDVLLRPHITEKATVQSESNAYTFQVRADANKSEIIKAIKELYKVTPKKINIVYNPAKKVFTRGKVGIKSGKKKAIVYLAKGDKIEFV